MLFFQVFDIPLKKHFVFAVEEKVFTVVRATKLLETDFQIKGFLFYSAFKIPNFYIVCVGRKKKFFIRS